MPLDNPFAPSTEDEEKLDLLNKYRDQARNIEFTPIIEETPELPIEELDFKHQSTEKAMAEASYLQQGLGDHPNMRVASKQLHKMPTPDEAEEQGIIGQFMDGVSDFSLGLATGVGYGVDELAVSASQLINTLTPDEMMEDADEYTGRYISKYMDTITERAGLDEGAGEAGRAVGQFVIGWMPHLRAVKMLGKVGALGKVGKAASKGIFFSWWYCVFSRPSESRE